MKARNRIDPKLYRITSKEKVHEYFNKQDPLYLINQPLEEIESMIGNKPRGQDKQLNETDIIGFTTFMNQTSRKQDEDGNFYVPKHFDYKYNKRVKEFHAKAHEMITKIEKKKL